MKYIISFSADYEFEVERKDRVKAVDRASALMKVLADRGFEVASVRIWVDDEGKE